MSEPQSQSHPGILTLPFAIASTRTGSVRSAIRAALRTRRTS